jgi:hypothetical protein
MTPKDLRDRLFDAVSMFNTINDVELADEIFGAIVASLKPILGRSTIELELLLGDLRREIEHQVSAATNGMVDLDWAISDIVDELLTDINTGTARPPGEHTTNAETAP